MESHLMQTHLCDNPEIIGFVQVFITQNNRHNIRCMASIFHHLCRLFAFSIGTYLEKCDNNASVIVFDLL